MIVGLSWIGVEGLEVWRAVLLILAEFKGDCLKEQFF